MNRAAIIVAALVVTGVLGSCGQQPVTPTPAPAPGMTTAPDLSAAPSSPAGATAGPTPAEPVTRAINVTVRGGEVSGDTGRVEVPLGTPVTVFVTSDVADEIHLHGYDREAAIPAGGVGSISFIATIPGVFEVELHEAGLQLLQLQVS